MPGPGEITKGINDAFQKHSSPDADSDGRTPLRVEMTSTPTGAATEATLATIATNTQETKGAGATDATTQRVVIVTDQTSIPVTLPSGQQTTTFTAAVTSGNTTAGIVAVSFTTDASWSGSIGGMVVAPSTSLPSINATLGKTLASISYTRTAGTLYIIEQSA